MLDVFDYSGNKICSQFDNTVDASGQAFQIYVTTERNGWKELSFQIPSVCEEDGQMVDNFRQAYLKADYRIRLIDNDGTDWFIISEPRITHQAFSKNISVTAGHVSQILKTKNLGLEFSDEEGNNIGTAAEQLTKILEGTGWAPGKVTTFYEKDGVTEKRRSLKEGAKSGAFKLISSMCDLFDAKPVFNGADRTVDIFPMNPFTVSDETGQPTIADTDTLYDGGVIELAYGKNVSNLSRTQNTENLVTKLYAYGSYGDEEKGYCGIDECEHMEYVFQTKIDLEVGNVYWFSVVSDNGLVVYRHFEPTQPVPSGSNIVWSTLDPASMSYVWDEANKLAYPVKEGKNEGDQKGLDFDSWCDTYSNQNAQNWFSFLMDFSYYQKAGLLNDEQFQKIAAYQRNAKDQYEAVHNASSNFANAQTDLSELIGSVNFCRIDVSRVSNSGIYSTLTLNSHYPNGVMYRTDYYSKESDYFKWRAAEAINTKGDPTNNVASVIYVVHNTDPVTWEKVYIKEFDDEENVGKITLWNEKDTIPLSVEDRYYLFESNNINGWLGALEISDEACVQAQNSTTKIVTTTHPVLFSETSPQITDEIKAGYGWWWKYDKGYTPDCAASQLYFCHYLGGDTTWKLVNFQKEKLPVRNGQYWYDWRAAKLYKGVSGAWSEMSDNTGRRIAKDFGTVYRSARQRDQLYQGVYQKYEYTVEDPLPAGNYYIQSDFDVMWVFTTKESLSIGDTQVYDTDDAWVIQKKAGVQTSIEAKGYRFDSVMYDESDDSVIVIEEERFLPQTNIRRRGALKGILSYMKQWPDLADDTYTLYYSEYKANENVLKEIEADMVSSLGDMYREGWWQSEEYVDGDEDKLYDDALDNLKVIAQPEATYDLSFVDLWSTESASDSPIINETEWNDLSITTAAHIIDPEIEVNVWAYIDKQKKCYDQPSKTTLAVNTNLSKMTLHSFTDVMTNIANVASEVQSMSSVYSRASAISSSGRLAADRLQGSIDAAKLKIFGGSSTWYTDEAGNFVFVSSDGSSAMTLTGNGFAIADSKNEWGEWNWRTFGTGRGFTADMIVAGYLSAERLEVGSIGAEKLTEEVRTQLEEGLAFGERITEVEMKIKPDAIVSTVTTSEQYKKDLASVQGVTTYTQKKEPVGEFKEGDLWIVKDEESEKASQVYVWDGDIWTLTSNNDLVRSYGTKIEQNTKGIESLVYDIEEQDNVVEKHETSIQQQSDQITANASSIENFEAWKKEAEVKITPEAIMSTVTSSEDYQNAISAANKTHMQYSAPETKKVGDQWVRSAPENVTWEDLSAKTFSEIKSDFVWGELIVQERPITYAWTGSEWKKISDLKEVEEFRSSFEQRADSIELRVEKAEEFRSVIEQRANSIELRVEEVAGATPDKLNNSAVTIDTKGVEIKGGTVDIKANSSLNVESGGTVKISADNGDESHITFGEAFSASASGVSGTVGDFDTLNVGGKPVLTADNLAGKIVIASKQPIGHGIIWLQPSSAVETNYSASTGSSNNKFLKYDAHTLAQKSESADVLPSGSYKYTIDFTVNLRNSDANEKNVAFTVVAAKAANSNLKVTFPTYTLPSISAWQSKTIQISVESSTNLCSDTGDINVTISASNLTYNYQCIKADTKITLKTESKTASGSVQPCNVFYLP